MAEMGILYVFVYYLNYVLLLIESLIGYANKLDNSLATEQLVGIRAD